MEVKRVVECHSLIVERFACAFFALVDPMITVIAAKLESPRVSPEILHFLYGSIFKTKLNKHSRLHPP